MKPRSLSSNAVTMVAAYVFAQQPRDTIGSWLAFSAIAVACLAWVLNCLAESTGTQPLVIQFALDIADSAALVELDAGAELGDDLYYVLKTSPLDPSYLHFKKCVEYLALRGHLHFDPANSSRVLYVRPTERNADGTPFRFLAVKGGGAK